MATGRNLQKRIAFLLHDGAGLGHLRRISRIAGAVQGACACLIVTGQRYAAEIVPEACEFVHLPSMDSLLVSEANYWGRKPFLTTRPAAALAMRQRMLEGVLDAFQPDAIVIDLFPLGKHNELLSLIQNHPARKYLVFRGLIAPFEVAATFGGIWGDALADHYDRILVTADSRIVDVAHEYHPRPEIARKIHYLGYVQQPIDEATRQAVRLERGITPDRPWVVCATGGGKLGETLIDHCIHVAERMSNVCFDLIIGPRSRYPWKWLTSDQVNLGHMRLFRHTPCLPLLHGSCDLLVSAGGYNSVVEAFAGHTPMLVHPSQTSRDDEQYIQTERLSHFYPLTHLRNLDDLERAIEDALERNASDKLRAVNCTLDVNGLANVKKVLFDDFSIVN